MVHVLLKRGLENFEHDFTGVCGEYSQCVSHTFLPPLNIYFCFIDYAKAFDCVDHNKLWKILKDMGKPPDLPLEKPVCR